MISEFVSDEIKSDVVEFDGRENELKILEVEIGKCKPDLATIKNFETEDARIEDSGHEESTSEG